MSEDHVDLSRVLELRLHAGVNEIWLSGLEPDLHPGRLRVHADRALVLSVDVEDEVDAPAQPTPVESDAGEQAQRREGARAVLNLLDRVSFAAPPDGKLSASGFARGLEALTEMRERAEQELAELAEATIVRRSAPQERRRLMLRLRAPEPVECRLELTSESRPATWRMRYRLWIDGRDVAIESEAALWQPVGPLCVERIELRGREPDEDGWRSTRPWIVSSERPYDERSQMLHQGAPRETRPSDGADDLLAKERALALAAETRAVAFPAQAEVAVLEGPFDLGGSEAFALELPPPEIEVDWEFRVRPVLSPIAFARLLVRPAAGAPALAPGRVAVFADGILRGSTTESEATRLSPWSLELGPQTCIQARRSVRSTLEDERLIQRGDVHRIAVRIEVESRLERSARVWVEDQVPLSSDPRVRIRLLESDPDDAEHDPSSGRIRLPVRLEGKQKARVGFTYEVEAPRDYRLVQSVGSG